MTRSYNRSDIQCTDERINRLECKYLLSKTATEPLLT